MVCLCFPFKNSNRSYWVHEKNWFLSKVLASKGWISNFSVFHHLLVQKASESTFSEEPHLITSVQVFTSTLKQLLQLQQLSGYEEFSGHSFAFILPSCAAHNFSFPSIPVSDQAKTFIFTILLFWFLSFFSNLEIRAISSFVWQSHFFFVWLNY